MNVSQVAYDLIRGCEQCRLLAYDDKCPNHVLRPDDKVLGTLTIGWGYTGPDVHIGMQWTQDQADLKLVVRVTEAARKVAAVRVTLTQNQFDALVVFVYNVGHVGHDMGRYLALGYFEAAANEFPKFIHSNGEVEKGLIERRAIEQKLFRTPDSEIITAT